MEHYGFKYENLPTQSPISTADVEFQEQSCNLVTLYFLLPVACRRLTGLNFPAELVTAVLAFMDLGLQMTREDAEAHRRKLMEDRTFNAKYDEVSHQVFPTS